ncbi:MAG: FAD-binding protein [Acidobacteria bacterium]|nr:FAD-binding protein [Acidobacteriota bacterium]
MDRQLIRQLKQIVGERYVLSDPAEMYVYECDGLTLHRKPPSLVVLPETAQQISEIVQLAEGRSIAYLARGAGTGLSGGALAVQGGLILQMSRMNRILEIDLDNRCVTVEPCVVNLDVSKAVLPHGFYFAPDPSSQMASTIGGNIAENSGGPHTLKYGTTVNHVLGLDVVLSGGRIVQLGGKSSDRLGYDLVGLFVGSEGTFGIVTKAILRLSPIPQKVKTFLAAYSSVREASQTVSDIIGAGIVPAALEMLDRLTIQAVEDSVYAAGYPRDAEAVLLVELDGLEAGMERLAERIVALCRQNAATEIRIARSNEEREKLWAGRKKAFGAMGRLMPGLYVQDAVIPRSSLPELMPKINAIAAGHGIAVANVFHAGDGNLHPNLLYDGQDPEQIQRVLQAVEEIMKLCVDAGGSITGEHGVGFEKKDFMPMIFSPEDLDIMGRVKSVFNPTGLCNPQKIFPTSKSCGESGIPYKIQYKTLDGKTEEIFRI